MVAADIWMLCSACKKGIAFGAVHWVCSVSTCSRNRTRLVFCSVPCWDSHVATLRRCGTGTWGARCPSLADYVTATDAYARGVLVLLPLEPGGLGRAQSEPVRLGPDEGEGGGKVLTLDGQLQAGEMTLRFASRIVGEHRRFLRKRREHGQDEERHPLVDRKWARAVTGIGAALVVTILCVAACADSTAICSRAGGEYANGACTLSGPSQLAVRHWCETHGGVHLAGPNICGYGSGGP